MGIPINFILFTAANALLSSFSIAAIILSIRAIRGNGEKVSKMYWVLCVGVAFLALSLLFQLLACVYGCSQEYKTAYDTFTEALGFLPAILLKPNFFGALLILILSSSFYKRYKKEEGDSANHNKILSPERKQRLIWFLIAYMNGIIVTAGMQVGMEGRRFSAYIYVLITWFVIGAIFMTFGIMKTAKTGKGSMVLKRRNE